jgi:RNA polymerase-binding transcription factor DksA
MRIKNYSRTSRTLASRQHGKNDAMPLTRRQTIELADAIRTRAEELAQEMREDAEHTRERTYQSVAGEVHDAGDEAAAELAVHVTEAELERDAGELEELEGARRRMEAGTYGACTGCGADIEVERLFARPGAPRCLACQRLHEKTFAR